MEKVYIGKIVNTFGIKGELKVSSDFEMAEKAFVKEMTIYIDGIPHIITNVRYHKNHYLVQIDNIDDINLVLKYKGHNIYFERDSLNLKESEYLLNDLLGLDLYEEEAFIGKVTEVDNNPLNPLIKVDNKFYIPLKGDFILKVDLVNKKIITKDIKGLML